MTEEPKEGDEQLGIITEIGYAAWYWKLYVPGLKAFNINGYSAFIPNPNKVKTCPVQEQQICMFRYSQWINPSSGNADRDSYFWQPVLDYFTEGQPSLAEPSIEDQD